LPLSDGEIFIAWAEPETNDFISGKVGGHVVFLVRLAGQGRIF
jgi:hypothetical protein